MHFSKLLLICSLTSILCFSCSTAEQKGDKSMEKIMKDYKAVGIQAVVVKNDSIIYNKAFGYKDLEKQIPLSTTDIMRIASISKSFTTTSLMQLVEQGKISLDDDVSDLIGFKIRNPKYPDQKITLKMILSHTSSIKDKEDYFTLDHLNPAVYGDCKESYYEYAPGEDYNYSNMGMNLAGSILEKVSGERFDNYVRNYVIRPLGLYGGHNIDSLDASKFAMIYDVDDDSGELVPSPGAYRSRSDAMPGYIMGYSAPIFSPTGGVKISAHDLAIYMMMHMNYGEYKGIRIISEESARTMQTPVLEKSGYGLSITSFPGYIDNPKYADRQSEYFKGHTGGAYGLFSIMFFNPIEKWGIVVMTNGCHNEDYSFLKTSVRALYKDFIE